MNRALLGGFFVSLSAAICIAVTVNAEQQTTDRASTYVVRLAGPVLDEWKTAIEAEGGELLDYVPGFAFRVRMAAPAAARVRGLSFVTSAEPLRASETLAPRLRRNGQRLYFASVERGINVNTIAATINASGARAMARGSQLLIAADSAQLDRISAIEGIAAIANFVPRVKHNEYGGGVILGSNTANASGYDGSSQTIAIADTGLGLGTAATAHPDLPASRISAIFNWPGTPDFCFEIIDNDGAQDVDSGHGTHVSTAAVGSGNGSGVGRGTAPASSLIFQAIENYAVPSLLCSLIYGLPEAYYLVGIPSNIGNLFTQAYSQGARVHSNSWGADTAGAYNVDSANADTFVWSHRDMAITFSAGNAGVDADADGVVDLGSVGSPATAKNVITVGASENDRQSHWDCDPSLTYTTCAEQGGQNAIFTYGGAWPDRYQSNPLRDDSSAGNAEQMAAFSSRGPTADGRIKPDVVAPGTWTLSGYASPYQQQYDPSPNPVNGLFQYDGWGIPADSAYKYMGGTSMSAPLVAGGAAVVRDFYQKARGHQASAALVKAALINTAVDLLDENNDGVLDNANPIPNPHEGWGRVDLVNATDASDVFFDEGIALSTGTHTTFTVDMPPAGAPLKATLVWTDYPAAASTTVNLVNDLDLTVTAPDGTLYKGNVFAGGWSAPGGAADRRNNVENVYVFGAAAGTWTITVSGFNIPQGPQNFALVVDTPSQAPGLPQVRVTADDDTATEAGLTSGTLRFTRSGDTSAALEVAYSVGGSATPGSDYVALSGFVTIPEGAVDATVSVTALDDTLPEPAESVIVSVLATPAYTLGSPSSGAVSIVSDDVPPDLTMTALNTTSSAAAGSTITVSATVKNQGAGPAPGSTVSFYLSSNTTWEPGDTEVATSTVSALAGNISAALTLPVTIPAATPGGVYYLLAKADALDEVAESNEANNVRSSTSITIGPDLVVASITAPATTTPGGSIQLNEGTRNQGVGPAGASTTSFYLSTNQSLDALDVYLGARAVNPLNVGQQHSGYVSVTVPSSTAHGTYYVLAQADSANVVSETIETNNVRSSSAMKIGADLSVTVLSMPGRVGAGASVNVSVTTANLGSIPSPESVTRLYFSVNQTVDASDTLLAERIVPPLSGAALNAATIPVTIPGSASTGAYYVIAIADATASVVETDETNNSRTLRFYVGPDLTIVSVGVPTAAEPGAPVSLTDTTQNLGGGVAPATETSFYLSSNTVLDASDILLGTRVVPELGGNAVSTATTSYMVPPGTPLGLYYVLAKADHSGVVAEFIETNNLFAGSLLRVGPDLSLTYLHAPSAVIRGTEFSITDTTRNIGSAAPASTTSYYLSVNATLDESDILLGGRAIGVLATGVQTTGQATVMVPVTQSPGGYYIIAKADAGNVVAESAEGNNTRYVFITVNP